MSNQHPRPPEEWLQHLHESRQWERLVEMSKEVLGVDPEDERAHFHLGWALVRTGRTKEMQPQVEFLLRANPEHIGYRQLAALYLMEMKQYQEAWRHVDGCLADDPANAAIHHLAAMLAIRQQRWELAKKHSLTARSLSPDDADFAYLNIVLNSMEGGGPVQAWNRILQYEEALALQPEHDGMLAGIGDVYLTELEDPKTAESFYRRALAIDPQDKHHQQRLWKAIKARNLFFRVLRVPISGWEYLRNFFCGLAAEPWRCVYLVIGIKFVLAFAIWLFVMSVFFAPAALCFEWLVLADITRASRWSGKWGSWTLGFHRLPFWVRFVLCLALTCGLWCAMFRLLGWPLWIGFAMLAALYGVHFLIMGVLVLVRRSHSSLAGRKARQRRSPPPLPRT
jgi:hypothetical protein